MILDNVSTYSVKSYQRVLRESGHVVIIGGNPWNVFKVVISGTFKKESSLSVLTHKPNTKDLVKLTKLLEDERLKPVIDKRFDFEQLPEAMNYYGQGAFQGKVVITNNRMP